MTWQFYSVVETFLEDCVFNVTIPTNYESNSKSKGT